MAMDKVVAGLMGWLDKSTCNFLAVETIKEVLDNNGFRQLKEDEEWKPVPGGKYYMVKNGTAIFAFVAGTGKMWENGVRIISAHSDSPCFKLKPNCEIYCEGGTVKLNVEKYGGGILSTWFDRPLSISGRVSLRSNDWRHPDDRVVDLRRPVATIPNLAIHFNRAVNDGVKLSVQKDTEPVVGYFNDEEIARQKENGGIVRMTIARELGVESADITDYELCLYPAERAELVGMQKEYLQSGRIDDLSMAFAGLQAIADECESPCEATRVLAVFDNEETGSGTKQGAHSPVLRKLLERICISQGGGREELFRAMSLSFMVSADDAHAWHPNYSEKYDPTNHALMGGGPVIKINANCKYMTDSRGAAIFNALCRKAGVRSQYFVNHSDSLGGSTLGNISTLQLDIEGVDVGNAIWAMHSARETCAVADHLDMVRVMREFFR